MGHGKCGIHGGFQQVELINGRDGRQGADEIKTTRFVERDNRDGSSAGHRFGTESETSVEQSGRAARALHLDLPVFGVHFYRADDSNLADHGSDILRFLESAHQRHQRLGQNLRGDHGEHERNRQKSGGKQPALIGIEIVVQRDGSDPHHENQDAQHDRQRHKTRVHHPQHCPGNITEVATHIIPADIVIHMRRIHADRPNEC